MKELEEANLLTKEIKDLKLFIDTLDVELIRTSSNVSALIKKTTETKTTYSIFGRRWFGIGTHEHTISVPTSMIPSLVIEAKQLMNIKEAELALLFNPHFNNIKER